jgi:hypothetical protein
MGIASLATHVRGQNWDSAAIELVIVIGGVFVGIQAANWNQQRRDRNHTAMLLSQVQFELTGFTAFLNGTGAYHASTGGYADRADAGWRGDPSVGD